MSIEKILIVFFIAILLLKPKDFQKNIKNIIKILKTIKKYKDFVQQKIEFNMIRNVENVEKSKHKKFFVEKDLTKDTFKIKQKSKIKQKIKFQQNKQNKHL